MTITINPQLEIRLRRRATARGQDPDVAAQELLEAALDYEGAIAGIERGLEASDAGRVRPADEVFKDMRARLAGASR